MGRKEVVMHYLAKQEGELWARPYLFELLPVVTDRTLAAVLCIHSSLIFSYFLMYYRYDLSIMTLHMYKDNTLGYPPFSRRIVHVKRSSTF